MKDHKKHRSSPQREERAGETWGGGTGLLRSGWGIEDTKRERVCKSQIYFCKVLLNVGK